MRRFAPAALGLVLALLAPARARAVDILNDQPDESPHHRFRSSQNFAFEAKFGPYKPDVDTEFEHGGPPTRTPYADYFGNGRHLMTQLELDWQIFRRFGSLGVGVGVGYFSVSGPAPLANGVLSGDRSTLKVIPFTVSLVYRFDYLLETRDLPLVPYGKVGFDYAYWQITDGNDEIAHDGMGGTGRGATPGWHVAAGLALMLDVFDPEAARDFDTELGVNHTAITFEVAHADISGLGTAGKMHLGDTTWSLGLLLEF